MVRVLGLDLATRTGYAVIEDGYNLVDCGSWQTRLKKKEDSHRKRFQVLTNNIEEALQIHKPDVVVIEELHQTRNLNSVKLLGGFYGVTLIAIPDNIPIRMCHQATAKKDVVKPVLGIAKLDKGHVFDWAVEKYELEGFILSSHNDITDAILMADWGVMKLTKQGE